MTKTYIKQHTNTFLIHGHEYEITAPARFDSDTNELLDDMDLDDKAVHIANELYRIEMDLVSPDEVKKYRIELGYSKYEFAQLLGWSANTIELYETGAFPSDVHNKILKELLGNNHIPS